MLPHVLLRYRRPLVIAFHLVMVPLAYYLAFALRFDLQIPDSYQLLFWTTLPYLLVLRLGVFAKFSLYNGWWRHAGMHDLTDLIKAATLSSGLFLTALFLTGDLRTFPRSVLVADWAAIILLLGGVRFAVRSYRERSMFRGRTSAGTRTLIIGAGTAAERMLRQFARDGGSGIYPVGLVDDDPSKRGMHLHGVPVLGMTRELASFAEQYGAELLVICIPSAGRKAMQELVERCIATGIDFKIVPSLEEILDGRARLSQLRSVQIEDLLGRPSVQLDLTSVENSIEHRIVLITGGAGSIGSELARQVARFGPRKLILLEQAESALYFTHLEIGRTHPGLDIVPIVGDITDIRCLEHLFAVHRPEYVFHAAAYKHVPLMEANMLEAVRNNVIGTLRVAECAARYSAAKFVLISTDKAVNPSSVMGATKRIAERIVLGWPSFRESPTDFRAVRFGNVLGSDGSVIPLFKRQLAVGGPLTVTHRDVTRYFMTIPEAVQLVLQASTLPEAAGRISMLDMGEPVRIVDLAENLIRLSGLEPYRDIAIQFTGLRPGEKMFEELMSMMEATVPTQLEKVRVVQTSETESEVVERELDRLAAALELGDEEDLLAAIHSLVPESVSPLRERANNSVWRIPG